jgi:hypothetical protein
VPVSKTFRAFAPDQMLLLPPSLDEWLPEDHLARFVAELVDEVLDLGPILASYTEKRGFPPYDPRLMVRLLIYGYTTGVRSSRAIERKCVDDVCSCPGCYCEYLTAAARITGSSWRYAPERSVSEKHPVRIGTEIRGARAAGRTWPG